MAKAHKFPHTYVIIFYLIIMAAALTWIIPGGRFERTVVNVGGIDREVIADDSFSYVESSPQTWQVFSAFFDGFVDKADIIVFILMIGGAFWILNYSKAIDVGILSFLKTARRFEKIPAIKKLGVDNIIMTSIILLFSIFGATFGKEPITLYNHI